MSALVTASVTPSGSDGSFKLKFRVKQWRTAQVLEARAREWESDNDDDDSDSHDHYVPHFANTTSHDNDSVPPPPIRVERTVSGRTVIKRSRITPSINAPLAASVRLEDDDSADSYVLTSTGPSQPVISRSSSVSDSVLTSPESLSQSVSSRGRKRAFDDTESSLEDLSGDDTAAKGASDEDWRSDDDDAIDDDDDFHEEDHNLEQAMPTPKPAVPAKVANPKPSRAGKLKASAGLSAMARMRKKVGMKHS